MTKLILALVLLQPHMSDFLPLPIYNIPLWQEAFAVYVYNHRGPNARCTGLFRDDHMQPNCFRRVVDFI